jgi:uncharacterized repeat protein (TIGR01451 family)
MHRTSGRFGQRVRRTAGVVVAALTMVGALAVVAAEAGAAPAPFPCSTSTIFIGQGNPTQLQELRYGSGQGSFTNIGTPVSPPYNAMGFSVFNHFIYAINTAGHVVQVASDGSTTDLGVVAPLVGGFVNVGAIDTFNRYFVMRNTDKTLYRVSVATLTATATPLSASPSAADHTFVGSSMWGETPSGGTAKLVRVNPTTGQVDSYAVPFLPALTNAGAAWTFGNGNLGLSDNASGTIYQIHITGADTATPTFNLVSSSPGPSSSLNDGTSCVSSPADLAITKSGPSQVLNGSTITYTLTVHNNGPGDSSGFTVSDTAPSTITNVSSPTPGCSVAGQVVTCVGSKLLVGQDAVFTVTGTVNDPSGGTVANTATVLGNEVDPDPGSNTSTWVTDVRLRAGLCRGTALQTTAIPLLGALTFANANTPEDPCLPDSKSVLSVGPLVVGLKAAVLSGATTAPANGATASSSVETTSLLVGPTAISIGAVQSTASATLNASCATTLAGSSNVASVTINGTTQLVGSAPLTIHIPAVGDLYLNRQIIVGTTIVQQAVFLDLTLLTNPDITIAESKAGAHCVS